MQHEAHELTGTIPGHVVPGLMMATLGLWWFWNVSRARAAGGVPAGRGDGGGPWRVWAVFAPLERRLLIAVPLAGAIGELWWASWRLTDTSIINYQHATAYAGFALAAAVDALAARGRVAAYVPHLAMAAAFANAALQFASHGSHAPVSDAVHGLVVWLFLGGAAAVLLELRYRHPLFSVAKAYGLVVNGAWFVLIAWMLYASGWDPADAYNVMRVYLFFTWTVIGTALAMSVGYVLLRPAVAPESSLLQSPGAAYSRE